ncbi:MAG: Clp protease N-terminal domain-containing protein [Terriglobales bacterium]
MFERYTEKARRAIFFALYEARHYGSPRIETEHILLGILREYHELAQLLPPGSAEAIRKQIDARTPPLQSVSTSVDLPLSNESKRVLASGAEEAERLGNRHIGTEHLLLGMLREESCIAAELLRQSGLTLQQLRGNFRKPTRLIYPWSGWGSGVHKGRSESYVPPQDTVEIHGVLWDADYLRDAVVRCRRSYWCKRHWFPRDIAVHRETGTFSFDVSLTESSNEFDLDKGGWKKDYCFICRWELFESEDQPDHSTAYTNGNAWLCTECYQKFLKGPDFFATAHPEVT